MGRVQSGAVLLGPFTPKAVLSAVRLQLGLRPAPDARVVSTVMSHVLPVQWSWVRRDTQRQHSEATLTGNTQRQYSEAIIKGNPQQYCLLETRIELHWKHYS